MLNFQQLQSLLELYPFFSTLGINCSNSSNYPDTELNVANCLQEIEDLLAQDFLEKLPSITTPRWKLVAVGGGVGGGVGAASNRQTTQANIQTTSLTKFELELNLSGATPTINGQAARIFAAVQAKLSSQNAETSFMQKTTNKTNFPFYV